MLGAATELPLDPDPELELESEPLELELPELEPVELELLESELLPPPQAAKVAATTTGPRVQAQLSLPTRIARSSIVGGRC